MKRSLLYCLLLGIIFFSHHVAALLQAQTSDTEWSIPTLIFEGKGAIFDPTIVADQSGGLHIFWRLLENSESSSYQLLYYINWFNEQWSLPVDIFASTTINAPSAVTNSLGTIHLVWQSEQNSLMYSSAQLNKANTAYGWEQPFIVNDANAHSQLVTDKDGNLYLVYSEIQGIGVSYQQSIDSGRSWSEPIKVSLPSRSDTDANFVRIAIGENGTIHVVWTEFLLPDAWPPIGTFYTQSIDGGRTWREPQQITGEGYNQINVVAGPNNMVHLVWNGMAGVHGRYHRWSTNDGMSWSVIETLNTAGNEGSTGTPPMVVDSTGTLHLLVIDGGCLLYLAWQEGWTSPECISHLATGASNFIEEPDLTLSEGNKLHVVFWDNRERLWYMTREVDAPTKPIIPFATLRPTLTLTSSPTPEVTTTPNYNFSNNSDFGSAPSQSVTNPTTIVFLSIIPTMAVLSIVTITVVFINKKR